MAEAYRLIIGLEVHVQLLTQTKLFCGCRTEFGLPPNTATCPVCLGLPGSLPVMNRHAFDLALRGALALNCRINTYTKWDRKQYYYPDLPKNYQISQYDLPFSYDGFLEIPTEAGGTKKVGIIRAHLEEDAGKSMHDESGSGGASKVDLNRTGTPLIEIVSKPEMNSPAEARAYLEELRLLLRELGVSDCEMQEGSLRCDANVNIQVQQADGSWAATPIVEVKNLNSIRNVERAIAYEAARHYLQYQADPNWRIKKVAKETRGWDETRDPRLEKPFGEALFEQLGKKPGATWIQRRKEEAADYRYFPEPDLVPVVVSAEEIATARLSLGELPSQQRMRLQQPPYSLSAYDAGVITAQGRTFTAWFESVFAACGDAKAACNWATNEVLAVLNERKISVLDFPLSAATIGEMIKTIATVGLNKQRAREVFAEMLAHGGTAQAAIDKLGFKPVNDPSALREMIRTAIAANPKAVADYKKGKVKAADAIKGAVMRETKGQANTETVSALLIEELAALP